MDISFCDIREKEVVNIYDGKKLGHIIDIVFDRETGQVQGVVVPGIKRFMRKSEDIFVPMANLKKIGEDVLLVRLAPAEAESGQVAKTSAEQKELKTYVRYRRPTKLTDSN
jgi:YlmC/YmxH family sporulation protein